MISERLKEYLNQHQVSYTHVTHPLAYTAQEVAQAQHVPGREVAKTLVLKVDGRFIMYVLPAVKRMDLKKLAMELPFERVELASEKEFAWMFDDSEVGAMSPFGNLYDLPVYVDEDLAKDEEIVFNAGTHVDTVRMKYEDYEKLVRPVTVHVH